MMNYVDWIVVLWFLPVTVFIIIPLTALAGFAVFRGASSLAKMSFRKKESEPEVLPDMRKTEARA